MDAVQIIVLVVVVLLLVAAAVALMGRRKRRRLQLAEQHRAGAREELRDLHQHQAHADEAEQRAAAARAEAERAERAAREARETQQVQAARAEDKVREADRLDPRVDHKADDYQPGSDRAVPGETRVDPETGRPAEDPHRL